MGVKPSPFDNRGASALGSEGREAKGAKPTWVVGAPVAPESRIGSVIEREYQVRSILSQGELGTTYQVFNTRLKSYFNVLFLDRQLAPTHEMMLAVRADLARARDMQALGLMPIRLVTDDLGVPGFATERLDGESLRQRVGRAPMPVAAALALMLHLSKALAAGHQAGLIHGDLRPENVFLVRPGAKGPYAGRVMVLEHSLRHLRRRPPGFDDSLPLGKLRYRPPEQVAGLVLSADQGGDIFVLGALLYECLTGRPAFEGEDVEAVLDNLSRPPPLLRPSAETGLTAGLAEALSVLVTGCCAPDPQARVPTVTDLQRALEQVVSGSGLTLPATVCENPPAPAPAGRVKGLLQRLSGAFQVVAAEPPVVSKPTPAVAAHEPPVVSKPAPAVAAHEPPVESRGAGTSAVAPPSAAQAARVAAASAEARPHAAEPAPIAAPSTPATAASNTPAAAASSAPAAAASSAPPVEEAAASDSQATRARGTLSILLANASAPALAIRDGQVSLRRPTPVEHRAAAAESPAPRATLQGLPQVEGRSAAAPPTSAAPSSAPQSIAAQLQASQSRALNDRTTRSLPLIEQVRQVRERMTMGHAIIDPNQDSQDALNERPTRSLVRARDITQLVAAVQQGKLAANQAVELAQIPEELPLNESDIMSTSLDGATPAMPLPTAPSAPLVLPRTGAPYAQPGAYPAASPYPPADGRAHPVTAGPAYGSSGPYVSSAHYPSSGPVAHGGASSGPAVPMAMAANPSSPTRRGRSSVKPLPRPQFSPVKRFLLQHQELVAAALGAALMLSLGIVLMQCR